MLPRVFEQKCQRMRKKDDYIEVSICESPN